jgi:hypothetical protein
MQHTYIFHHVIFDFLSLNACLHNVSTPSSLRPILPCYAQSCRATPNPAVLRPILPCYAQSCRATPNPAVLRPILPCYAQSCRATPNPAVLRPILPCRPYVSNDFVQSINAHRPSQDMLAPRKQCKSHRSSSRIATAENICLLQFFPAFESLVFVQNTCSVRGCVPITAARAFIG